MPALMRWLIGDFVPPRGLLSDEETKSNEEVWKPDL